MDQPRIAPDHRRAVAAYREFLDAMGLERDICPDIIETPERVVKSWTEMTAGYGVQVTDMLRTTSGEDGFDLGKIDQMISMAGMEFESACEHHMLPFIGTADIAYLSKDGRVIGASKFVRVLRVFSQRLQVQERLTEQLANAFEKHVSPDVGVAVRATHMCMMCRGVRTSAVMSTEVLRGKFRNPEVRAEFWHLTNVKRGTRP